MSRIKDLNKLGQSVWLDFIRRSLIDSGELEALIARGVSGITSNPTIFEKAIAGSSDYDEALLNRAFTCSRTGRFAQARRDLESACALKNRRACGALEEMKGTGRR